MKTFRLMTLLTLVSVLCLISFISLSWSVEKIRVPSSSAPASNILQKPVPVSLFSIKVFNSKSYPYSDLNTYMNDIQVSADLVPRDNSQEAKDAIVGKTVRFFINGTFVGENISQSDGHVFLEIKEHNARNLKLQVGTHQVMAQTKHGEAVIKGQGTLEIGKAQAKISIQYLRPSKTTYAIGEPITLGGILEHGGVVSSTTHYPIPNVNVNCVSVNKIQSPSTTKNISSVQTNNQGGFECQIPLAVDVFDRQNCNLRAGFIGASFESSNYKKTIADRAIQACPSGMNSSNNCPSGCATCCK